MKRVIIESPYAVDVDRNLRYLRACLRDSLMRGEAPFASHAIYTQPGVLCDDELDERQHGIFAGYEWWKGASLIAFYVDLGWSNGMQRAWDRVLGLDGGNGRRHEIRNLGGSW